MPDPEIRSAMAKLIKCPCSEDRKSLVIKELEVTVEHKKGPGIETYYTVACLKKCGRETTLAKSIKGAVKMWAGLVGAN